MPSCAVKGCKSWNMKDVRFFTFPKEEDVRELWIMACNRPNVNWLNARICSLHFSEDDWRLKDKLLNTDRAKRLLDKKAIPNQNLPVEMPVAKIKEMNKIRFDDRVKPKNILALNEKVAAIRRYEVDPVYKSVGRYFNCSPDQIKRIIMQKDEILNEWDNRTKKSQVNLTREMKTVKISFLGKAVHEWIRRMMYYSDFNLTDALIQTMAIEFKKALHLPNFFPDKSWVASFRNTYNLKEVSTKTLDIGCQEGLSVQIRDILSYLHSICGSSEGAPATAVSTRVSAGNHTEAATLSAEHKSHPRNAPDDAGYSCSSTPALGRRRNPIPAPSTKEAEPLRIKSEPAEEVVAVKMEAVKMETDDNVITHEEAMHYVKQLEEFALLKENFRLIGLVERLEEALKEAS